MTHFSPSEPLIEETIARYIREVPSFPRPGISFKDITPLIENGPAFHTAVEAMARATEDMDYALILSAEARGFVFGTALAYRARKGLILARKPNKLPRQTISAAYDLEYGQNTLEIHNDAASEGVRVLVVDDLLATGGTYRVMCQLVENAGGIVAGVAFLLEIQLLNGRERLAPYTVTSITSHKD